MRRSNTQSLSEVLREYIEQNRMHRKLKEVDVVEGWEKLLGKTIAHYTRNIYIRKRILFVEISSAVVKNELFMMREEIRRRINENAGEEIVEKIIFK
jgi:predicted nucleic acid-binding Zn ribbon protein